MAASGGLLGDASCIDTALDSLFAKTKSAAPVKPSLAFPQADGQTKTKKKRKEHAEAEPPLSKKRKTSSQPDETQQIQAAKIAADRIKALQNTSRQPIQTAKGAAKISKDKQREENVSSQEIPVNQDSDIEGIEEESVDSDAEIAKTVKRTRSLVKKEKPEKMSTEERQQRDARTIFIGNVPIQAATDKSVKKSFTTLIESHLDKVSPENKITVDSIRFRSLPLTSAVSKKGDSKNPGKPETPVESSHSAKRSQSWAMSKRRGMDGSDDDESSTHPNNTRKQDFLTPAQKRKVAYITGDLQPDTKAKNGCNAYVVLSSTEGVSLLVKSLNGITFMEHTLRTDIVSDKSLRDKSETKRTVFVGGLDFEEGEDGLRQWLEKLLVGERGDPKDGAWVETVRIVRDSTTGLGKGFAYVCFKDTDCVDDLMAIDSSKLKLSKKKIRFEKYKSAARLEAAKQVSATKTQKGASSGSAIKYAAKLKPPPKMSKAAATKVGDELAVLSKDERKTVKSANVDRVARRLEKKKAKSAALKRESRMEQVKKRKGDSVLKLVGRKLAKTGKDKATSKKSR